MSAQPPSKRTVRKGHLGEVKPRTRLAHRLERQLTRVWSEIQLTSQFLPPSFEYDCSKCGDLDVSADQSN